MQVCDNCKKEIERVSKFSIFTWKGDINEDNPTLEQLRKCKQYDFCSRECRNGFKEDEQIVLDKEGGK